MQRNLQFWIEQTEMIGSVTNFRQLELKDWDWIIQRLLEVAGGYPEGAKPTELMCFCTKELLTQVEFMLGNMEFDAIGSYRIDKDLLGSLMSEVAFMRNGLAIYFVAKPIKQSIIIPRLPQGVEPSRCMVLNQD